MVSKHSKFILTKFFLLCEFVYFIEITGKKIYINFYCKRKFEWDKADGNVAMRVWENYTATR
jgi:hypothetical protein